MSLKIGDYGRCFVGEKRGEDVCFILGVRQQLDRLRGAITQYLVAHRYDIEWRFDVGPLLEGKPEKDYLCKPHAGLVFFGDLPEEWTKAEFGNDKSCGWIYVGPDY